MKKNLLFLFLSSIFLIPSPSAFSQCIGNETFNYTGSIQSFIVPPGADSLTVYCYGAAGGNGNQTTSPAGLGATISGKIAVTPGETLNIIVGQMGFHGILSLEGGGGGGGSFVIRSSGNVPLMIAGGGGGGSYQANTPGYGGTITTTGGAGGYVPTLPGQGGFTDNGGGGGTGAGGGGWDSNGLSNTWAFGGIMQGGAGGVSQFGYAGHGGYGGGGAAFHGGGGGGGYSGGGGGTYTIGGGGGASYNTGIDQSGTPNSHSGNGMIVLEWDASYFITESQTICHGSDFTFPDGSIQTNIVAPVVYTSNLIAINGGCDSIIETSVSVHPVVDATASLSLVTITATSAGLDYQWIDCNNGNSIISGEINQSFTATTDGSYAVIVTENGCADTSACFPISFAGLNPKPKDLAISLFPNPASSSVELNFGKQLEQTIIEVKSITGAVVLTQTVMNSNSAIVDVSALSPGIYFIQLITTDNYRSETIKLIKK